MPYAGKRRAARNAHRLQRDPASGRAVLRAVHDAHTALSEHAEHSVRPDRFRQFERAVGMRRFSGMRRSIGEHGLEDGQIRGVGARGVATHERAWGYSGRGDCGKTALARVDVGFDGDHRFGGKPTVHKTRKDLRLGTRHRATVKGWVAYLRSRPVPMRKCVTADAFR